MPEWRGRMIAERENGYGGTIFEREDEEGE